MYPEGDTEQNYLARAHELTALFVTLANACASHEHYMYATRYYLLRGHILIITIPNGELVDGELILNKTDRVNKFIEVNRDRT